jgi:hypothetical protein
VGGAADGSLAVVEEFSTLHFRSSFNPGSIVGRRELSPACLRVCVFCGSGVTEGRGGVDCSRKVYFAEDSKKVGFKVEI